jgi:outer membrane protein W
MKYSLLLAFLIFTFIFESSAQQSKQKKSAVTINAQKNSNEMFLKKQVWLGLKAGTNLVNPILQHRHGVIQATNYDPTRIHKKYNAFNLLGSQIALEFSYYFHGFTLSFQPGYQQNQFDYTQNMAWSDDSNPLDSVTMHYTHTQKVDYLVLPLILKYEFPGNKLRPYVQAGVYQNILLNATKNVAIRGVDLASGGVDEFKQQSLQMGAKDLFAKNQWGLIGGAGIYYNLGNVRLNLDVQYFYGMSSISNYKNRYDNNLQLGTSDAFDDLSLNALSLSVGCLFPMRFLQTNYKSLDRK